MSEASQIVIEVAGLSRQGRRPSNEDAADWKACAAGASLRAWAVVCDGMGGHNAGEVASAMVLRRFQTRLGELTSAPEPPADLRRRLAAWVAEANAEVLEAGRASLDRRGMGTTLAVAFVVGDRRLVVGNVGDSKVFLVRGEEARQLSIDHTAIAEQRRALGREGPPTKADSSSPFAHALTRSLGGDDEVAPDISDDVDLEDGDLVLLTSDGVTDVLEPPDVVRAVERSRTVADVPASLYDAAFEGGSKDNITAVVIAFGRPRRLGVSAPAAVDTTAPTAILAPRAPTTRPMATAAPRPPLADAGAPGRPRTAAPAAPARGPDARPPGKGAIVLLGVAVASLVGAAALVLFVPHPGRKPGAPPARAPGRSLTPGPLAPGGAQLLRASVALDGPTYVFRLDFDRPVEGETSDVELRHARVATDGGADLMGTEGAGSAPYPWRLRAAEGSALSFELEQSFTVFGPGTEKGTLKPGSALVLELASASGSFPPLTVEAKVE